MKNEEKYLKSQIGTRNPFTVPEGYFDSFTARMMEQLPERTPVAVAPSRQHRLRVWLYAAACAVLGLFGTAVYFSQSESVDSSELSVASTSIENYLDEAADYVMVDNHDIYACLASDY